MRSALSSPAQLFAQADDKPGKLVGVDLKDVSKHVNDGIQHDLPWELLLVGLGATLIAIVAITMRRWWLERQDDPSPLVLYSAIARKAGLGWADRFVLWRIARVTGLPTPIALLLSRGALRHYAKAYTRHRSPRSAERVQKRLADIEATLFA